MLNLKGEKLIPAKYFRFVFSFFMAFMMSFIISGVMLYIAVGFVSNFFYLWMLGWGKALVVAYPCVLVVGPLASKLASKIVSHPK